MSAQQPTRMNRSGLPPVTAAVRQRLQAVFEHGQRSAEKADYDYAHDLFSQCLVEDPANLIYLQHFLGNLAQKYGNNKKGVPVRRAEDEGLADDAQQGGRQGPVARSVYRRVRGVQSPIRGRRRRCSMWPTPTSKSAATNANSMCCVGHSMPRRRMSTVNRKAAEILTRLGQFDQAISCWRRVEQAKPGDEEAAKAISKLSVEKTIQKGGYNQELLQATTTDSKELEDVGARARCARTTGSEPLRLRQSQGQLKAAAKRNCWRRSRAKPADVGQLSGTGRVFTAQNRLARGRRIFWHARWPPRAAAI